MIGTKSAVESARDRDHNKVIPAHKGSPLLVLLALFFYSLIVALTLGLFFSLQGCRKLPKPTSMNFTEGITNT